MDDNSYPQANAGANELTSAPGTRHQQFQSTASKQARSRGAGNGSSTRSRASPRPSPYDIQAVAGRDGPVSVTPASESSLSVPQDGLGRQDVVVVDARGTHLRFPFHTRYPPVRVVKSGSEDVVGGSLRDHRAVAPRPASRVIGEGGDGAGTTQPLSSTASQNASVVGFADRALTGSVIDMGQPGSSRPARARDVSSRTALHPGMRHPLEDMGPYYRPSLMDPVGAAERAYVSPYPPLPRTDAPGIDAPAIPSQQREVVAVPGCPSPPNQPLADAETAPYATLSPSLAVSLNGFGAQGEDKSSDNMLQAPPADLDGLAMAQLEHLDFAPSDTFVGGLQPLTGPVESALNDAWTDFFANDDMYVPMDEGFDFSFLDGL